jgi:hypothetical protein
MQQHLLAALGHQLGQGRGPRTPLGSWFGRWENPSRRACGMALVAIGRRHQQDHHWGRHSLATCTAPPTRSFSTCGQDQASINMNEQCMLLSITQSTKCEEIWQVHRNKGHTCRSCIQMRSGIVILLSIPTIYDMVVPCFRHPVLFLPTCKRFVPDYHNKDLVILCMLQTFYIGHAIHNR